EKTRQSSHNKPQVHPAPTVTERFRVESVLPEPVQSAAAGTRSPPQGSGGPGPSASRYGRLVPGLSGRDAPPDCVAARPAEPRPDKVSSKRGGRRDIRRGGSAAAGPEAMWGATARALRGEATPVRSPGPGDARGSAAA